MPVSIIVPNYNHANFLRQRMDSILNQTFQDYEIILLDDASSDGSAAILKEYQHHEKVSQFVTNQSNSGNPFIQWQKGLSLARFDYIWIAETDDVAEPELLSKLYDKLVSSPDGGLAYCQSKVIDDAGEVGKSMLWWTEDLDATRWLRDFEMTAGDVPLQYLWVKNFIPNASAVLFKKSILLSSHWVPGTFRYVGDWHAWIEIARSHSILFCAETLNYHRAHASTTRTKSSTTQYILELYEIRRIISRYSKIRGEERSAIFGMLFRKLVNSVQLKSTLLSVQGYRMLLSVTQADKKFPIRLFQYLGTLILK